MTQWVDECDDNIPKLTASLPEHDMRTTVHDGSTCAARVTDISHLHKGDITLRWCTIVCSALRSYEILTSLPPFGGRTPHLAQQPTRHSRYTFVWMHSSHDGRKTDFGNDPQKKSSCQQSIVLTHATDLLVRAIPIFRELVRKSDRGYGHG